MCLGWKTYLFAILSSICLKLPTVKLTKGLQYNEKIVVPLHKNIILQNYNSYKPIKAPLAT